jgi:hypothetical protein
VNATEGAAHFGGAKAISEARGRNMRLSYSRFPLDPLALRNLIN